MLNKRPSKMEVKQRRSDVRLDLQEQIGGFGNWKDMKIGEKKRTKKMIGSDSKGGWSDVCCF